MMAFAAGCHEAPARPETPPPPPPPSPQYGADIYVPTYDGSGETVHPDFAEAPEWWPDAGQRFLAITPYPGGNQAMENPSLFQGQFDKWRLPKNGSNPVRYPRSGHLSDPDLVFNPDAHQLWLYYRQVTDSLNVIKVLRSDNGTYWPEPAIVTQGPNHTIVSPTVVRRAAGDWLMWAVNAGGGCSNAITTVELRRSPDGLEWSEPETVELPLPPSGLTPWHLEVQWIPALEEFWAVFNGKDSHGCGTKAVYLSTSPDGVHWITRPDPLLVAGRIPVLKDIVYRTTFRYDAATDSVTFWYSGATRNARDQMVWRTAVERISRAGMTSRISATMARGAPMIPASDPLADPPLP